jgi:hypothetical protein
MMERKKQHRARICKRLWSPEIDSKESIQPAYVGCRAGTTNRVVVPARQAGNRFLGSLKGLQIRDLEYLGARRSAVILSVMRAAAVMALLTACRRPTLQLYHPWRLSISDPGDVKSRTSNCTSKQCFGSGSYPDPGGHWHTKIEKVKKFHVLLCSMFFFDG